MANGPALITTEFPKDQRGGALGILAMIVSLGLISGPAFGGILVAKWGWRSIFWMNLPVGIFGIWIALKNIRKDQLTAIKEKFDWLGSIAQFIFLFFFVELFEPPNLSVFSKLPNPPHRLVLGFICVFLLLGLILIEQRAKSPVIDLSLFKDRVFSTSVFGGFSMFAAYSAISVLMPMFLEESLLISTGKAGVLMTAIPITMLVTAPISGRLSDKFGSRGLCASGAIVLVISLLAMAGIFGLGLNREMPTELVFLSLCGVGLGMGLFQSPNNNSMMSSVHQEKLGVASAMVGTVRNLGAVIGAGLGTSVFSWLYSQEQDFIRALHLTFLLAASIALLGLISIVGKASSDRGNC
jgi:MFS family permease